MAEQQGQKQAQRIKIDDRGVDVTSSDYWLVSGTPEEVVLRFGSAKQNPGGPVKIANKVGLSYATAKRLLAALAQTVAQYEKQLGAMTIDHGKS